MILNVLIIHTQWWNTMFTITSRLQFTHLHIPPLLLCLRWLGRWVPHDPSPGWSERNVTELWGPVHIAHPWQQGWGPQHLQWPHCQTWLCSAKVRLGLMMCCLVKRLVIECDKMQEAVTNSVFTSSVLLIHGLLFIYELRLEPEKTLFRLDCC